MRTQFFALVTVGAFLSAFPAQAQDSRSLGDAARQARQQKDATAKTTASATAPSATTPKPTKVITNEDLPEAGSAPNPTPAPQTQSSVEPASHADYLNVVAERMKAQIQSQKAAVASLEAEIASLNDSVRYAGANCVANCVEWNQRQKEKQDRVIIMQQQLAVQQQRLADLQESARKKGFGSTITDP